MKNSGEWRQQQIAFFQVEAGHFPLLKFQRASHNTEVEYITNGRPGEVSPENTTLHMALSPREKFQTLSQSASNPIGSSALVSEDSVRASLAILSILICFPVLSSQFQRKPK